MKKKVSTILKNTVMLKHQSVLYFFLMISFLQIPIGGGIIQNPNYSTILFAALDSLFLFIALLLFFKDRFDARLKWVLISLLFFFAWALFSSGWSNSDRIGYSLALLTRDFLKLVTVLFLAGSKRRGWVLEVVIKAFLHAAIIYSVLFLATASYAYDFEGAQGRLMYQGFKDANQPARDLSLFLLVAVWAWHQKFISKNYAILVVSLVSVAFVLSFSKTSLIALTLAILYLHLAKGVEISKKVLGLFLVITCLAIFILFRIDYFYDYLFVVQGGSALATMSGRTLIWELFYENFPDFWLIGAGIDSFVTVSAVLPNNPGTVHNEFMNIAFNYGFVGVLLFVMTLLSIIRLGSTSTLAGRQIVYSILLFFLVTGLTESNLVTSIFSPYLMLLFCIISVNTHQNTCVLRRVAKSNTNRNHIVKLKQG